MWAHWWLLTNLQDLQDPFAGSDPIFAENGSKIHKNRSFCSTSKTSKTSKTFFHVGLISFATVRVYVGTLVVAYCQSVKDFLSFFCLKILNVKGIIISTIGKSTKSTKNRANNRTVAQPPRPPRPVCRVNPHCVRKWLKNIQKSELLHNLQDLQDLFAG